MKKKRGHAASAASRADRYDLYQRSVQTPAHEVPFFDRVFKREYGRSPHVLREDFCGTFAVCCEWARSRRDRIATGIDIDRVPLDWGERHNLSTLRPEQRQRVKILQEDVRLVNGRKADVVSAQNFSFWVFKTRDELREYFRAVYQNLGEQGTFILDMMGGAESMEEDREDITEYDGFDYVWDQARFDPITHDCCYHIHFRFPDGSKLSRSFTYHWRFWTLPEVREILHEVGFNRVDVYWEGTNAKTGEGNDVFRVRRAAPNDPAWICYVAAVK